MWRAIFSDNGVYGYKQAVCFLKTDRRKLRSDMLFLSSDSLLKQIWHHLKNIFSCSECSARQILPSATLVITWKTSMVSLRCLAQMVCWITSARKVIKCTGIFQNYSAYLTLVNKLKNLSIVTSRTPVSLLRTRLIHISPSYWTVCLKLFSNGKCPLDCNSNSMFYANHCFKKNQTDMNCIWRNTNCRSHHGLSRTSPSRPMRENAY